MKTTIFRGLLLGGLAALLGVIPGTPAQAQIGTGVTDRVINSEMIMSPEGDYIIGPNYRFGGPTGYTYCAGEGGSYTFTSLVDVAYGANGSFYYKYGVTGTVTFNPSYFGGDPIFGVVKAGYYKPSTPSDGNLALNKAAYASTNQANHLPASSTNGTKSTWWSSTGSGKEWIYVDLGTQYDISQVQLAWGDNYPSQYTIDGSKDKNNWTTLQSITGHGETETIPVSGRYQYVRMNGLVNTMKCYDLQEFRVYGANQFYVDPHAITIPGEGNASDPVKVSVFAPANWIAVSDHPDWCTVSPSNGYGQGYFKVTASYNGSGSARSATVKVYNPNNPSQVDNVIVDQKKPDSCSLTVNPGDYQFKPALGKYEFTVTALPSSKDWSVDDDSSKPSWISWEKTSDTVLTVKVIKNDAPKDRSWAINLHSGCGSSATINITQQGYLPTIYTNMAIGREVSSLSFMDQYFATNAVDDNSYTYWHSEPEDKTNDSGTYDKEYFQVDLGGPYAIRQVVIKWGKDRPQYYEIQVSQTGLDNDWATIASNLPLETLPRPGDDGVAAIFAKATNFTMQYVRVNCKKSITGNGYEIHEFQVWCQ